MPDITSSVEPSPQSAPLGVPYYALDTLELIGRRAELAAIDTALDAHTGLSTTNSHAIVFRGPGGVGKTRLLRAAVARAREKGMLTSGIIDLYHSETHSNSGIEAAIIQGLEEVDAIEIRDRVREIFQPYQKKRKDFEALRAQAVGFEMIEQARSALRETFVNGYNTVADQHPILILFDTAELIQFENDVIQRICRIENVAVQVKTWLAETLPRLHNTVVVLAGRGPRPAQPDDPRVQLWEGLTSTLKRVAAHDPSRFREFELGGFANDEGLQYFDAVIVRLQELSATVDAIARIESVPSNIRADICRKLEGRPIRLGMAIDLLIAGEDIDALLAPHAVWNPDLRDDIIKRLYNAQADSHTSVVLDYLAATRYGLDAGLLHYLEPGWSLEQCGDYLKQMETLSFVKVRRETQEVFLHDDMYDLMADGVVRAQEVRFREIYGKIAGYYKRLAAPLNPTIHKDLLETYQVKQVHYGLYHDPKDGFALYAKFDHAAIEGFAFGLDMKLRDELLRFYNDDTNARSAARRGLSRAAIDRDSAARWIQRYLGRFENRRAADVAEVILLAGPEEYRSIFAQHPDQITQPQDQVTEARRIVDGANAFFWGRVLTFYGEALAYLSAKFQNNQAVLERAVATLESIPATEEIEFPRDLRMLIVGRAHNNLGYLYHSHGWYGQALDEYRRALSQFPRIDQDDRANTLNNMAYLLGLFGRIKLAKLHIDEAIAIRDRIGKEHPLALSRSTLGRIYTQDGHPIWGAGECQKAVEICERLREPRGLGLALLSLGFALRQRGDQWKIGVYPTDEAIGYFKEAETQLKQAVDIFKFQVTEPTRLWEGYNELGSLHDDWGWLDTQSHITSKLSTVNSAFKHFRQSIEAQEQALQIADQHDLLFQRVDSTIDLAQVYGDRSFLYRHLGRHMEAQADLKRAEAYLFDVQTKFVPRQFHLVEGLGFGPSREPEVAFWLHLGESHMWRGVWAFRDVGYAATTNDQREEQLSRATHDLIASAVYFQQYWPTASQLDRTLRYLGKSLREAAMEPAWAHKQVDAFEVIYPEVELKAVRETIDDMLGI